MDGTEFARELIKHFGPDRFYHCYKRMGGDLSGSVHIYTMLSPPEHRQAKYPVHSPPPWKCAEFFKSIGMQIDGSVFQHLGPIEWGAMCMVAYGFCKSWKEFGLKTRTLPDSIHARMILGDKNEWTEEYARMLDQITSQRQP